jgi:two-component system, chemotaxis family, protein-glutamate methylesterase/glutaminase
MDVKLPSAVRRDIVVLGASAGGIEALREIVATLPDDLGAAVFVVLHIGKTHSELGRILAKSGPLTAATAVDGQSIKPGRIYVAAPDSHLMLDEGVVRVWRGPRENRSRPAIDPLFRSAALHYGPRVVAALLSGGLDDGVAGLRAVQRHGGKTLVQDPADALYPTLPRNALQVVIPDMVLPAREIGPALVALVGTRIEPIEIPVPDPDALEHAAMKGTSPEAMQAIGAPTPLTCPECHGALFEMEDGEMARYRCHTGHAFTADSLAEDQDVAVEHALWGALRALRENAQLARTLSGRAKQLNLGRAAEQHDRRAEEADRHAEVLAVLLEAPGTLTE